MAGTGIQPAGTTPAAYGAPVSATDPRGKVNRDVLTGDQLDARFIDQRSGRYQRDASGRLVGMSSTRQIVQLAIKTTLGTAADKQMGNELRLLDRITDNFQTRVLDTVTRALQRAIAEGLVTVDGFTTFKAGPRDGLREGQVYGRLAWTDLTTGQRYEEVI